MSSSSSCCCCSGRDEYFKPPTPGSEAEQRQIQLKKQLAHQNQQYALKIQHERDSKPWLNNKRFHTDVNQSKEIHTALNESNPAHRYIRVEAPHLVNPYDNDFVKPLEQKGPKTTIKIDYPAEEVAAGNPNNPNYPG